METRSIIMAYTAPPSLDDMAAIAEQIIDDLPQQLEKYVGKLTVEVEDFPDAFIEQELELETPFDILGIYQSAGPAAIGRTRNPNRQDTIILYRRPILDAWCETGEDLLHLVNRVILQEIGFHFGFTEDDIDMMVEDFKTASSAVEF